VQRGVVVKVLPAIDLREGACVQLVGGRYEDERVRLPDPAGMSRKWAEGGLREQHIIDLDAATGRGSNGAIIEEIAREPGLVLQVGGGVRDEDAVARLFDLGVARVVVGTRGVLDAAWLERVSWRWPFRVVLAADVRGRTVLARGWTEDSGLAIDALLERISGLPLAGVLVTAVHVEGTLGGVDIPLFSSVARALRVPLYASGGIGSVDDLRVLARTGATGAVVGMALYTGKIDPSTLEQELSP
jgi:phosphoribosylformimino-5-aminoimidazole carboxamide ribotide isomerase